VPRKHRRKPSRLPQILAITGVLLLVGAILVLKEKPQAASPTANTNESPQAQLDRALSENRPTLAFFHSTNCHQCLVMMEVVAQVYPEFDDSITLVDINVYDESNQALLQRVRLQYIPTLIFYDKTGQGQVSVGVIEAEQLRQTLVALAEGE